VQQWVFGLAAVTLPVWGAQCGDGSSGEANVRMENQHWVHRAPKNSRDMVTWLSIVRDSGDRFGAAQRRSAYRWIGEAFRWRRDGDKLTMSFPQSDRKVTVKVKPYKCDKDIFDRCLDLTWKGRTVTLYSMEDLRIRDAATGFVAPPDGECDTCVEGAPEDWVRLFEAAAQ